ncbi:hypothetical protein AB0J35_21710 [Nonomuraea angiospora]|uniref:hypothetical protein n=1 Tax=Nonomuraea angiospora TaxID=46172 RepID=UPI003431C836
MWENTGQVEPGELPAPLADGAALEALRRLKTVLAPTQGGRATAVGPTGRLLAPDGRYEFGVERQMNDSSGDTRRQ